MFDLSPQRQRGPGAGISGLGLGLTVVRALVEMHGGYVEAHSEGVGRGSRLVVHLPIAAEEPDGVDAQQEQLVRSAPGAGRILVVDDNVTVASSFVMLLSEMGYEVYDANDGPTALEAARRLDPRVVFLDIGLPHMDGYEVARRLRAEHGADMTLVALTGYGEDDVDAARSRQDSTTTCSSRHIRTTLKGFLRVVP